MLYRRAASDKDKWVENPPDVPDRVTGYFQRLNDHAQIGQRIIQRYGVGVEVRTDKSGKSKLERYTRTPVAAQVSMGTIEKTEIGFGHTVVSALACLFTDSVTRFKLQKRGNSKTVDPTASTEDEFEVLQKHRLQGGFESEIVVMDEMSVQAASSIMFLDWVEDSIQYQALDPGRIQLRFGPDLVDGDLANGGTFRATSVRRIEDASCIILRVGEIGNMESQFVAIFGCSEDYENGRYCTYTAPTADHKVPEVNTAGCWDYLGPDGGPANPLTLFALEHQDRRCPEYPVVIFRGGHALGRLVPVSDSLVEDSIDADVAAAHLRSTSQDNARGTLVLTRTQEALTASVPRVLNGIVDLQPGQDLKNIDQNAAGSVDAYKVLKDELIQLAQSWSVPDYMVVSDDHTVEASSGVALEVKSKPLKKKVKFRAKLNALAMSRFFDIEKAFIQLFDTDTPEGVINSLLDCEQDWEFLGVTTPISKKENADRVVALGKAGVYDIIDQIRETYGFSNDEDAIKQYERMKERMDKYPPLNTPEVPDVGFNGAGGSNQTGRSPTPRGSTGSENGGGAGGTPSNDRKNR